MHQSVPRALGHHIFVIGLTIRDNKLKKLVAQTLITLAKHAKSTMKS